MPIKTLYPHQVTQTTGGKYQIFKDKDTIKNYNTQYAESYNDIQGKSKSPNRPSTLICTDFRANLPTGSVINKIEVEFRHVKTGESNQKSCNITAPNVRLISNGHSIVTNHTDRTGKFTFLRKGQAPTMVTGNSLTTFTGGYSESPLKSTLRPLYGNDPKGQLNYMQIESTKLVNTIGTVTYHYEQPSINIVNASNFGVQIEYPTNANEYTGKIRVYWVRIKITYTTTNISVGMKKIMGGYNKQYYEIKLTANRTSKTNYTGKVTLQSPLGMSFVGVNSAGNVTVKDTHTLEWVPVFKKGNVASSNSISLLYMPDITYAPGQESETVTFTASHDLGSVPVSHNAVIYKDDPSSGVDPDPDPSDPTKDVDTTKQTITQKVIADTGFNLDVYLTENEIATIEDLPYYNLVYVDFYTNAEFTPPATDYYVWVGNEWVQWGGVIEEGYSMSLYDFVDGWCTQKFKVPNIGKYYVRVYYNTAEHSMSANYVTLKTIELLVIPEESSLTTPSAVILKPTTEELNRLGNGYSYTAQTYLKEVTSDTYVRDWYKNFRIGVFNNQIKSNVKTFNDGETTRTYDTTQYDSLSEKDIIENAEYWSKAPDNINEYTNLECQFMYDNDYPLYIIITGDYTEASTMASIKHTEPCIIETDTYTSWETNGTYPIPLLNLLDENDSSTLELIPYQQSNGIVLYDFPLTENFGTDEYTACRGVSITGTLEQSNEQVLYATLQSPSGDKGTRSIILNDIDTQVDDTNEFTVGGAGDLFGYSLLDLTRLENWEIILNQANLLSDTNTNSNIHDIKVNFYMETVEKQNIDVYVNGENISFYNAFITNIKIPPGLDTNVDYLNVDGTDTNDAYRQNVKEKKITLELEVGEGCDLELNTTTLRQLVKLFTNEKDEYNRPIPNRIQFSHYPDAFFEYILEESPEIDVIISAYGVKMNLVIPSGTSYSLQPTVTNVNGYVQGLTSIEPVITIKALETNIEITETISGQKFNMGFNGDWNNYIVEIDCANREVHLLVDDDDDDPLEITQYVDFNSDWFRLHGEYNFVGTNCVVRSVTYDERW